MVDHHAHGPGRMSALLEVASWLSTSFQRLRTVRQFSALFLVDLIMFTGPMGCGIGNVVEGRRSVGDMVHRR